MHECKDEVATLDAEFLKWHDDVSGFVQGAWVSTWMPATAGCMEARPRVRAMLEASPQTKFVQRWFKLRPNSHRLRGKCAKHMWVSLCNRQLLLAALRL